MPKRKNKYPSGRKRAKKIVCDICGKRFSSMGMGAHKYLAHHSFRLSKSNQSEPILAADIGSFTAYLWCYACDQKVTYHNEQLYNKHFNGDGFACLSCGGEIIGTRERGPKPGTNIVEYLPPKT